jgi:hypothetical protein
LNETIHNEKIKLNDKSGQIDISDNTNLVNRISKSKNYVQPKIKNDPITKLLKEQKDEQKYYEVISSMANNRLPNTI